MSRLGGLFARKADPSDAPKPIAVVAPQPPAAEETADESPLEIDEELFSSASALLGSENEELRNLLIDASSKIGDLDTIKVAIERLVDPMAKALKDMEADRAEKINLQTVLNNTRTAYGKLRNQAAELERRASSAEQECDALRQDLAATQTQLRAAEATKSELAVDLAARRVQIADLEARFNQESGEARILREENKRLDERLATGEKRIIALEAETSANRQRLMMAEDEKQAQQAAFEKTSVEAARLARKLTETEAAFATTQTRLRAVEANFLELNTERGRLAGLLDENRERHEHEVSTLRMRFDTLQARTAATEKLMVEAREHLIARAEEIRDYDRRNAEMARERDALQARLAEFEVERHTREAERQEIEQSRSTLMERSAALARAYNVKEGALARAEEIIGSLNERITTLEASLLDQRQAAEQTVEELSTSLRREKMQRAVAEGALETARKDVARLTRETSTLKREHFGPDEPTPLQAANAA